MTSSNLTLTKKTLFVLKKKGRSWKTNTLDPNKRVAGNPSQNSLSGDEIAKVRKRLRTNTKKLHPKQIHPVPLPLVRRRVTIDKSKHSLHIIRGVQSITKRRKSITAYCAKDSPNKSSISKASCATTCVPSSAQFPGDGRVAASECPGKDSPIVSKKSMYQLSSISRAKSISKVNKSEARFSVSKKNVREKHSQEVVENRSEHGIINDPKKSVSNTSTVSKGSNLPNSNEEPTVVY